MRFHRNPHRLQGRQFLQFGQTLVLRSAGVFNTLNIKFERIAGAGGSGGGGVPASASQLSPPRNTNGEAGKSGQQIVQNIYGALQATINVGIGAPRVGYSLTLEPGTTARYFAEHGYSGSNTTVSFSNGTSYTAAGGGGGLAAWQDWWPTAIDKEGSHSPWPPTDEFGFGGWGVLGEEATRPPARSAGGDGAVVITYGRQR